MSYRIKDIPTTAGTLAADDYIAIDGTTNNGRKFALKAALDAKMDNWASLTTNGLLQATGATAVASTLTPAGLTSLGVNSITSAAATDLTLTGNGGASLTLGNGANGSVTLAPVGSGKVSQSISTLNGNFDYQITNSNGAGSAAARFVALNGNGNAGFFGVNGTGYVAGRGVANSLVLWNENNAATVFGMNNGEVARLYTNLLIGGTSDITGSGGLKVFGSTAASSKTTGAFQVVGGAGIGGNLYVGGIIGLGSGTSFSGSLNIASDYGVVLRGSTGTNADIALSNNGGAILLYNTPATTTLNMPGKLAIADATAASSTSSGAFQVVGGAGFGGKIYVANDANVAGSVSVTGPLAAHQTALVNLALESPGTAQLVTYGPDASTYGLLNLILRKAGTGTGQVYAASFTSTSATLAGNLTVNGTGTHSFAGNLNITTSGTQILGMGSVNTISRNASTGTTIISTNAGSLILQSGAGTTAATFDTSQNTTLAGNLTVSGTGTSTFAGPVQIAQTGPQLVWGASTGTSLVGFLNSTGGRYISLEGNRNPTTGVFVNTSGTHVGMVFDTGNADGSVLFRTSSTNNTLGADAVKITKDQSLLVYGTTASTSTSTGALVVSGGVGVAGKIYAGNDLNTAGLLNVSGSGDSTFGGTVSNNSLTVSRTGVSASSLSLKAYTDQPTISWTNSPGYYLAFSGTGGEVGRWFSTSGSFLVGLTGDSYGSKAIAAAGQISSNNGTVNQRIIASGTAGYVGTSTTHDLIFQTNSADRVTINSTTGNATFNGTVSASTGTHTFGGAARTIFKVLGASAANNAPIISLFRTGEREGFIAQGINSGALYIGNSGGLADYNDATLAAAANISIATSGAAAFSASVATAYAAKTANYTTTAADSVINCTANSFTVTLVASAAGNTGMMQTIKNTGSGTITIATSSSQLIDGASTYQLARNESVSLVSTGSGWIII